LFVASQEGYLDITGRLLDATADVNKSDLIGLTPLYIASEKNHLDIVKALLVAGASQVVDALGGTSLAEYSFDEGRKEVAEILTLFAACKDNQK
jgi:ankyrin repeat protein